MRLTASIVTYHTPADELTRVLDTLEKSEAGGVYVVDNASDTATEILCRQFAKVQYIASENRGYGAGHNQALRRALEGEGRYHLVMNSDLEFTPEALTEIADFMDSRPDAGACQPKIVNPDGTLQYTVRQLPTPLDLIGRRFIPGWKRTARNNRYEMRNVDHDRMFNAPVHQGSFMFLRLDALREVGLFDERFFMYPEDIDLTRRIHARYLTLYIPSPVIVHHHRAGSYHSPKLLFIHCVNMVRYFLKWM